MVGTGPHAQAPFLFGLMPSAACVTGAALGLPSPSSSWSSYSDTHFTEAESLTKVTEGPVRWTLTVSS